MATGGPFLLPTPMKRNGWREVVWYQRSASAGRVVEVKGQIRMQQMEDGSWRLDSWPFLPRRRLQPAGRPSHGSVDSGAPRPQSLRERFPVPR